MVEKIFCIMSNSEKYLKADILAEALLKQITLSTAKPTVVFAVKEIEDYDIYMRNKCQGSMA